MESPKKATRLPFHWLSVAVSGPSCVPMAAGQAGAAANRAVSRQRMIRVFMMCLYDVWSFDDCLRTKIRISLHTRRDSALHSCVVGRDSALCFPNCSLSVSSITRRYLPFDGKILHNESATLQPPFPIAITTMAISFTVNFTPNLDKAYNRLVLQHVIGSPIHFFDFCLKFFDCHRRERQRT